MSLSKGRTADQSSLCSTELIPFYVKSSVSRHGQDFAQIVPVAVPHLRGNAFDLCGRDVAHAIGNLLDAGYLQALPRFNGFDKHRRLNQRFRRAGVEPGEAATEALHAKLTACQVLLVDVRDLQFSA